MLISCCGLGQQGKQNMESLDEVDCDKQNETPKYNWVDITQSFLSASSDLQLGELLHDSSFGLFEAMSAIEMMDPKMDAGMLCNQIKRKVFNLEQAIEEGIIKTANLEYTELIGIMDSSLACLVTWIEGHSLAQTVFTNLYLHNPYLIEDRFLKAFSIIMLKTVDHIRERINRAGCIEEEDFQSMSYGFKMAGEVTDARALGMVKEVEDELAKLCKSTRSKQGEERSESQALQHELVTAVHIRLKFYRILYSTLLSFAKDKCEGLETAQKQLIQLADIIPLMKASVSLGLHRTASQPPSNEDPSTIMGFEPLINQRLLPPTFPRYTQIKPRPHAMDYFSHLVSNLQIVTGVPELTSLHTILDAFMDFSKSSPCVLSRSILQLVFLPPSRRVFGQQSVIEALKDGVKCFIAPPVLSSKSPLYNHAQAKEYVDALMSRASRPMVALFQVTGHNRARQRDKWGHLLEDLSNLQEEADKVDAYLHSALVAASPQRSHLACLGTWVLYHTLTSMLEYTLSGFELELYATYEYHYVYWYLYELLYAWMVSTLHRADSFLMEAENQPDSSQKGRASKKKNKKKRVRTLTRELTIAQALQQMYGGYYKAVVGFQLCGKLSVPVFQFDKEEVRYTHRFAPFAAVLTPPFVSYSQYRETSDLNRYSPPPTAQEMFGSACKCFCQAKELLDSVSSSYQIQTMIKIAKTNFVVMKLVVGGHKLDSKDPPEFDFSQSKVLPVIKVT